MITIPHTGLYFGIAFAVMLLATWLMGRQGRFFFTKDPIRRKFSILEMEFPAKSYDLENLINGIYMLPGDAVKTIRALRAQFLLDYLLFIPAAYGGVFILCMHLAGDMQTAMGRYWFIGLAWAQVIAFILDYIENTYYWIMIGKRNLPIPKPTPFGPVEKSRSFKIMRVLEIIKWGLPLLGFICCVSLLACFWLSGRF
jgi:hypothetical protein